MNDPFFSRLTGVMLIIGYGVCAYIAALLLSGRHVHNKRDFLVANRSLDGWTAAFSIAATWIWAPALFLASQKAYTQGLTGVFWFTVPNVACLLIFAHFAARIRRLVADGYTLSDYMRMRYSRRVQYIYIIQLVGLAACSCAVQLLAGGKVVSFITGLPFGAVTAALALIALSYSLKGGLRASVQTDYLQMIIIVTVSLLVVPWAVHKAGGPASIINGLGGIDHKFSNIISFDSLGVAWSFGVPVTIGLLAGPFGDQSFWQRAFAIEEGQIKAAFQRGALLFALVPISLSILGFLAAGNAWQVDSPQLVNIETVARLLPKWVMIPMALMLLSGLVSTIDSNLCAVSCIAGHDWGSHSDREPTDVRKSRLSMVALSLAALGIANIPDMKILYLFLFYGTLRASTLVPTIVTLLKHRIAEHAIFYGILTAIIVGLPLFAYGNFNNLTTWKVLGAILTVGMPGLVLLVAGDRT